MSKNIPKSWSDISVGQYIMLMEVEEADINPVIKLIRSVAILLKKEVKEVELMTVKEAKDIKEQMKFLSEPLPSELIKDFKLDGKRYSLILNASEINGGQYASISNKLKGAENDPNLIRNSLHEILTSVSTYTGVKPKKLPKDYYSETAKVFYDKLPISIAYPCCVFFCEVSKRLTLSIVDYLSEKSLKMTEEVKAEMTQLLSDGDGGLPLTTSQMETLKNGVTTNS